MVDKWHEDANLYKHSDAVAQLIVTLLWPAWFGQILTLNASPLLNEFVCVAMSWMVILVDNNI